MSADLVTDFDNKRLAFEERRFAFEQDQAVRQERLRIWSVLGTAIPLLTALLALGVSLWTQHQQAELQIQQAQAQFQLKAAELIVGVNDPFVAKSRAEVLRSVFPHELPRDFGDQFVADRFTGANFDDWTTVAKLIIQHPDRRKLITDTWLRIYPNDKMLLALTRPNDDRP